MLSSSTTSYTGFDDRSCRHKLLFTSIHGRHSLPDWKPALHMKAVRLNDRHSTQDLALSDLTGRAPLRASVGYEIHGPACVCAVGLLRTPLVRSRLQR